MTRDEALTLGVGDLLYHRTWRQGRNDSEPYRVRVTGRVRTWKRDPHRIEIPTKHGMYENHTITEHRLGDWYTTPEAVEQFRMASASIQSEFALAPDAAEAARLAAEKDKVDQLVGLLTQALRFGDQESAERVVAGLDRLGARQKAVEIVDRYNRGLPPFRGAKGRWRKRGEN